MISTRVTLEGHARDRSTATWVVRLSVLLIAAIAMSPAARAGRKQIEQRTLETASGARSYFFYRSPAIADDDRTPRPLLILLHGSGRDGSSLTDHWWKLADRAGMLLAAPNASDPRGWRVPQDGPELLFELVEALAAEQPVDRQRVYLFGHSAGASFALQMALVESEYFAAAAVHAGRLVPDAYPLIDLAKRKVPLKIIVGTRDPFFPLDNVRATRDTLVERGFAVELEEISGHDHDYYVVAGKLNRSAWSFLAPHALDAEPWFETYTFQSGGG